MAGRGGNKNLFNKCGFELCSAAGYGKILSDTEMKKENSRSAQVLKELIADIRNGHYKPHSLFPSETGLAALRERLLAENERMWG